LEHVSLYAGLLVWSFLAATMLPLGSEVALIAVVKRSEHFIVPVLVATTGNYLGACTTYLLAYRASEILRKKMVEAPKKEKYATRLISKYGQPVLIFSWVPLVGDVLVAIAGVMRIPFTHFSFWVILGKGARYWVVAWAASYL
jgi:membrane protein YqaA with SNARE-associated domain